MGTFPWILKQLVECKWRRRSIHSFPVTFFSFTEHNRPTQPRSDTDKARACSGGKLHYPLLLKEGPSSRHFCGIWVINMSHFSLLSALLIQISLVCGVLVSVHAMTRFMSNSHSSFGRETQTQRHCLHNNKACVTKNSKSLKTYPYRCSYGTPRGDDRGESGIYDRRNNTRRARMNLLGRPNECLS